MSRVTFNQGSHNTTAVSFMINTNKAFYTETKFNEFSQEMGELTDLLFSESEVDKVFGKAPLVENIEVQSFGVEVGDKQHRGHIHLLVEIKHQLQKYSIRKLRIRLYDWLVDNYPHYGWNLYLRLAPVYQKNYNNKAIRKVKNSTIPETEEVKELSDERDLVQVTKGMTTLSVLEGNENVFDSNLHRKYNKK